MLFASAIQEPLFIFTDGGVERGEKLQFSPVHPQGVHRGLEPQRRPRNGVFKIGVP
jgi:hypothetical protein